MSNALPPVPYRTPMVDDNGVVTQAWSAFFRELWNRAGGSTGQSTTDLAATASALEAEIAALRVNIADASQGRTA